MTAHAWAATRCRRGLAGMTVLALWIADRRHP